MKLMRIEAEILTQSGHSFDDLILDTGELENQLIKFIAILEVTQKSLKIWKHWQ
jgi:hypothetical protein